MTDLAVLKAEKNSLQEEIAKLSQEVGRPMPGRNLPSPASAKISRLQLKLNVLNMKIAKAHKADTKA